MLIEIMNDKRLIMCANIMNMPWSDGFYCTYCGKDFGNQPGKLALHIRDFHEKDHLKRK